MPKKYAVPKGAMFGAVTVTATVGKSVPLSLCQDDEKVVCSISPPLVQAVGESQLAVVLVCVYRQVCRLPLPPVGILT